MARSMAAATRWIWAVCLAIGTCTHVAALIQNGWTYDRIPLASVVFWNALTILDPLAAILLFLRPRLGVAATLAIMVTDVVHNTWVVSTFGGLVWMVAAQVAFLLFTLATAPMIWRASPAVTA